MPRVPGQRCYRSLIKPQLLLSGGKLGSGVRLVPSRSVLSTVGSPLNTTTFLHHSGSLGPRAGPCPQHRGACKASDLTSARVRNLSSLG